MSCLKIAGISPRDIDFVIFYEKPFLKFDRIIETAFAVAPFGMKNFCKFMPVWVTDKLFQKENIFKCLNLIFGKGVIQSDQILFCQHHQSHAASAFFPSTFQEFGILTLDGVGEWATGSLSHGCDDKIEILRETAFPHSVGMLYSSITQYLGFRVNSGEYKVMGLAPYGKPKYFNNIMDNLITVYDDGSIFMDMDYFEYCSGESMVGDKLSSLFDVPIRKPESPLGQIHMDIAASIQKVTEHIVIKQAKFAKRLTGSNNLCMAGGVALNCVSNGKLLRENLFKEIWVQPAAGDAGGAIGAAYFANSYLGKEKVRRSSKHDCMLGSYLGPEFSSKDIEKELDDLGATFEWLDDEELFSQTAKDLAEGKAVGWMQGRMEFGPRSLGNRSILADPRSPETQKNLNLKVKFRKSFRPFAPSVLEEHLTEWFDTNVPSPYMLFVSDIKRDKRKALSNEEKIKLGLAKLDVTRSEIPAVTHVDYSARVQTVSKRTNERFHRLITSFHGQTGCPVVVNTSFNVRGEPIVCSPSDAFRCFMGTHIETLVIGNFYLKKTSQNPSLIKSYEHLFELD